MSGDLETSLDRDRRRWEKRRARLARRAARRKEAELRARLATWGNRLPEDPPVVSFSTLSSKGVIAIRPVWPLGQLHAGLFRDGVLAATLPANPAAIARDIAAGRLDRDLGFAASGIVPSDIGEWEP